MDGFVFWRFLTRILNTFKGTYEKKNRKTREI